MHEKVLVVTAGLDLVDQLGLALMQAGFELHHAWSLKEGTDLLRDERFEVLLLHVGVPDSSGFSLFIQASLQLGQPALIVLADHHDEAAMVECLRLGAQDFVALDELETSLLEQRIRHAIERNQYCQDKLGTMGMKLLHAEERERRRFAEDLHDQLGHNLAAASLKLATVSHMVLDPGQARVLGETRDLVEDAIRYTRTVTYGLGSLLIAETGLVPAIEWLVEEQRKCHDMRIEMRDDGQSKPVERNMAVLLYQAARELLANVVKHSNASRATVTTTRNDNIVYLEVEDDGVGFDAPVGEISLGFGLHSIRERIEFMGGGMFIDSERGKGSRVRLVAPLLESQPSSPGRQMR